VRLSAGFNQPTALATDGLKLYIADSEASAIRELDLAPSGMVRTIVGAGFLHLWRHGRHWRCRGACRGRPARVPGWAIVHR